jgi:hypothetical protein
MAKEPQQEGTKMSLSIGTFKTKPNRISSQNIERLC